MILCNENLALQLSGKQAKMFQTEAFYDMYFMVQRQNMKMYYNNQTCNTGGGGCGGAAVVSRLLI